MTSPFSFLHLKKPRVFPEKKIFERPFFSSFFHYGWLLGIMAFDERRHWHKKNKFSGRETL